MLRKVTILLMVCVLASASMAWAGVSIPTAVSGSQTACSFQGAWDKGYNGTGVVIGVIDDGIQMDHPYYGSRVLQGDCRTFLQGSSDATGSNPVGTNNHGTSVTGCATAYDVAGGIFGAAYNANIVGIRTDLSDVAIVKGLNYAIEKKLDIVNNSYGSPQGYGTQFGIPDADLSTYSAQNTVKAQIDATNAGVIIVMSAGNERQGEKKSDDTYYSNAKDSNKKALQANPYVITVGATGGNWSSDYQKAAVFSCYGSNLFCTAPGISVKTSDRTGSDGYGDGDNASFSGTSASAPVATGVMALAIDAAKDNPEVGHMSTRLMKHLLVQTCDKIDLGATGAETAWVTNAAGNSFSPTYGFGQINAEKLTAAAATTNDVTPRSLLSVQWVPDDSGTVSFEPISEMCSYLNGNLGITSGSSISEVKIWGIRESVPFQTCEIMDEVEFTVADASVPMAADPVAAIRLTADFTQAVFDGMGVQVQNMEEFTLTIAAQLVYAGDLQIEVTSPGGTKSTIAFADDLGNGTANTEGMNDYMWTFTSNAFWGEDPIGEWTIDVYDMFGENDMEFAAIATGFYMGEIAGVPEPATWLMLFFGVGCLGVLRIRRKRNE